MSGSMRTFASGATRDNDDMKLDYEGYLSPQVLRTYGEYMLRHQVQADGAARASDNWKNGIPRDAYMKSMWRHFMDVWRVHQVVGSTEEWTTSNKDALCALLFNVMGYLYELENNR